MLQLSNFLNFLSIFEIKFNVVVVEIVCNYMLQQNRPYSAVDVWNNLRQEYPKTVSSPPFSILVLKVDTFANF